MNLDYDQWIGALCLFREARGCTITQINAVWWVINNRANDPAGRWPKDVADVVLQPYQFSSFNQGSTDAVFPARKDPIDWAAFQNCMLVVSNPLGDDPTGGANSYLNVDAEGNIPPGAVSWADPTKLTLSLGTFRFYRL